MQPLSTVVDHRHDGNVSPDSDGNRSQNPNDGVHSNVHSKVLIRFLSVRCSPPIHPDGCVFG